MQRWSVIAVILTQTNDGNLSQGAGGRLKQTMATRVRELADGHPHSDNIDTDVNFGIRSILAWPDRLFVVAFITMLLFIVFFGLIFHIVF